MSKSLASYLIEVALNKFDGLHIPEYKQPSVYQKLYIAKKELDKQDFFIDRIRQSTYLKNQPLPGQITKSVKKGYLYVTFTEE